MRERPILFSGAMVRALLDGSKTQTRRALRNQVTAPAVMQMASAGHAEIVNEHGLHIPCWACPYGQPGDRLWVRETHSFVPDSEEPVSCSQVLYAASSEGPHAKWRPSIHMPRWASRILLEVVSVRVERLDYISAADAKAEGIKPEMVRQIEVFGTNAQERATIYRDAAVRPYQKLWEQINGAGSWGANPWVWVVEFKRLDGGRGEGKKS